MGVNPNKSKVINQSQCLSLPPSVMSDNRIRTIAVGVIILIYTDIL